MKTVAVFFLCAAILVTGIINSPANDLKVLSPDDGLFLEGVKRLYQEDHRGAFHTFQMLADQFPEHPAGPFCLAFTYDAYMDEYRTLVYQEQFEAAVNESIRRSELLEKNGEVDANTYLYWGGAYGIRGVREAMIGSWWQAFKDGLRGKKQLNKVFDVDSTFYDGYYGTGNYHYWKSVKSKVFWWLPFIGDNREKGIREIYIAMRKGKFAYWPSKNALMRIFVEEKRWYDLFPITEEVLMHNPSDLHARWFKGYGLVGLERWGEALPLYTDILQRLQSVDNAGLAGLVECWYYIGLSYYKLENRPEAHTWFQKIVQAEHDVNKKLFFYEDYIESAKQYLKRIKKES